MSAISTSAKEAPKHAKEILKFRGLKPTQANINKIYQEMFNEGKMLSLEGGRAKLANFNKNMWAKHKYRKRGADAVRKDLTKQRQMTKFVEDSERATEPFSRYLNLPNRYKPETYKYYSKVTTGKTPRDFGNTVMDEAKRFGIKPDEPFTLLDMATKGSNRPTPWGLEIGGAWSRYAKTDPGYRSVVDKAWSNFKEMKDVTDNLLNVAVDDLVRVSYSPKMVQWRGPKKGSIIPNRSDQVIGGHRVSLDFEKGTPFDPRLTVFDRTDLGTSSLDRFLEGTSLFNKVLIRGKL